MPTRASQRRHTRVPPPTPARENPGTAETEHETDAASNEELSAQLDLATQWYAQAMSSTDWEVANRGIRNARDTLDFAQRQLVLKGSSPESEPTIVARCARLLTDVDRAQALLHMRIARHPTPQ